MTTVYLLFLINSTQECQFRIYHYDYLQCNLGFKFNLMTGRSFLVFFSESSMYFSFRNFCTPEPQSGTFVYVLTPSLVIGHCCLLLGDSLMLRILRVFFFSCACPSSVFGRLCVPGPQARNFAFIASLLSHASHTLHCHCGQSRAEMIS